MLSSKPILLPENWDYRKQLYIRRDEILPLPCIASPEHWWYLVCCISERRMFLPRLRLLSRRRGKQKDVRGGFVEFERVRCILRFGGSTTLAVCCNDGGWYPGLERAAQPLRRWHSRRVNEVLQNVRHFCLRYGMVGGESLKPVLLTCGIWGVLAVQLTKEKDHVDYYNEWKNNCVKRRRKTGNRSSGCVCNWTIANKKVKTKCSTKQSFTNSMKRWGWRGLQMGLPLPW